MSGQGLPPWARPRELLDLFRLAGPVAVSRASVMLMHLTDAVVLARHAPAEVPFVANGFLPIGVCLGFGMGLLMGVQVLAAELSGQGRAGDSGRVWRRGLAVAVGYGALVTALCLAVARPLFDALGFEPGLAAGAAEVAAILAFGLIGHMMTVCCSAYLEALRRPNIVTAIMMTGVVINLGFNLVLVPQFGAAGVAWATTGTRYLLLLAFLVAIWRLTPGFAASARGPAGEFGRQNSVGLGAGVANVAEWGSFNLTFVIATWISLEAGTVYFLATQMIAVCFMLFMGLGTATSVRVAERHGRGDGVGVRDASRLGLAASFLAGLALGAALWLLREPVASLSLNASEAGSDGAALAPALAGLIGFAAFVALFDGLQGVASMALRAQGVIWTPTFIHVGSYMLVMLPLAWVLGVAMGRGAWGVMEGVFIASLLAGLAQSAVLEARSSRAARAA
jgi:MATE family multidrug resistance protein